MAKAAQVVIKRIISPIEDFMKMETAGGLVLMAVTILAMAWANSPFHQAYHDLIHLEMGFSLGSFEMYHSLHYWINDGLMVIFFFVVGLEIKRELIIGELSSPKKAALPMFAALGGMIVPALIYTAFNYGEASQRGWGIPMATDIAFAVGVLTLLSRKVPFALKIFLLALAIVDDLGAVLVIAFFYTDHVAANYLGVAALIFLFTYLFRTAGIKSMKIYLILGVIAWYAVLKSGIHATIAGVVLGLLTPIEAFLGKFDIPTTFKDVINDIAKEIEADQSENHRLNHSTELKILTLNKASKHSIAPLDYLIHLLHPWVSYLIMPLFALVNAGVYIEGISVNQLLTTNISLGVIFGLLLGKPVGVTLFSYLAVKSNIAALPRGVTWMHMLAVSFLAGIGFTMALFVSHLALKTDDIEVYSKLGILTASILAGLIGSTILLLSKDYESEKK